MEKEKSKLKLIIHNRWLCLKCGHEQEIKNGGDEEWQKHCDEMMRMQPYRKFEIA